MAFSKGFKNPVILVSMLLGIGTLVGLLLVPSGFRHPSSVVWLGRNVPTFSIVVLPDTQHYARAYPQHLMAQTQWIKQQVTGNNSYQIRMVVNLGDITDNNRPEQWAKAKRGYQVLDGFVPYALTVGNHDIGPGGSARNRRTAMNRHFPAHLLTKQIATFQRGQSENSLHMLSVGSLRFMILMLEFGPRDEVLEWARLLLQRYPNRPVMIATHSHINENSLWAGNQVQYSPTSYALAQTGSVNGGEGVWEKLINRSPNIKLVLNGHFLASGIGRRIDRNQAGGAVYQMLSNYQMQGEGGDGYLRIVTFNGVNQQIKIKTYSPVLNRVHPGEGQNFQIDLRSETFVD